MATLVLGTVGRVFGGPLGGIIGTAVGGIVDRSVLGGGRPHEVGRMANLEVQSAAYGEPIPVVSGRMRVAGNLVWTSGIAEASRSSGGKRGGATTNYSYSASFAVGLVGRAIVDIGRIWADGTLIRDAAGAFVAPVTMRLHRGGEGQAADPLIVAAEGESGAPAYRGLAYAVFEDLPLADYGNRIPNLTFEIIADAGGDHDIGRAMAALMYSEGRAMARVSGVFPAIAGHFAGQSGSIGDAVASLLAISDASVLTADGLCVAGRGDDAVVIDADECRARASGVAPAAERRRRLGGESRSDTVEVAYHDVGRDYQPGLQRARRGQGAGADHYGVACAMAPDQAKQLATDLLARVNAGRVLTSVQLPWRHLGIMPGMQLRLPGDTTVWRVREARFERFVVAIDLERCVTGTSAAATGDGGRALADTAVPAGATVLHLLDLPPLPGGVVTGPRQWVAAAGASAGWRRAGVAVSSDDGVSYAGIGVAAPATVQGTALTALGTGAVAGWDRFASVDIHLLSDAMWLEGRPASAVLAGGNLALIGDELVQFAVAEPLGARRFRLSGLLRGRRGTEAAVVGHAAGERFVLLDPNALLPFDPPLEALGRSLRVRAEGAGDADTPPLVGLVGGRALRPLSPAHLRLFRSGDDIIARWVRRSRTGFGWSDFVDAPLGEAREAYRVDIALDGDAVRSETVTEPCFAYAAADRITDGGGSTLRVTVRQLSDAVGPGTPTTATLALV
ncbi:MAG: phage tail baseplate protein [Polymorphobacter sp.]